eukprot:161274_1
MAAQQQRMNMNMMQQQRMNMNMMQQRRYMNNQMTQQNPYNGFNRGGGQQQQPNQMNGGHSHNSPNQMGGGGNGGNGGNNQQQQSSNGSNNGNKGPTKDTWVSPFKNREQNMNFFMKCYKCQPCSLRRNCPSKVTCPGWHHEGEKRRNPGEEPDYLYSEEPCPNVKPQGSNKWQPPSRCTDGDDCGYSHTLLEQMYHPNIYKTSMCINFTNPQGNKCQWGFYCTHAHGQDDIRNPNKGSKSNPNSAQNGSTQNSATNINKNDTPNGDNNSPSNSNLSNNNIHKLSGLIPEKKKKDARMRSMSAGIALPTVISNNPYSLNQGQNNAPNTSMHLQSPQMP